MNRRVRYPPPKSRGESAICRIRCWGETCVAGPARIHKADESPPRAYITLCALCVSVVNYRMTYLV